MMLLLAFDGTSGLNHGYLLDSRKSSMRQELNLRIVVEAARMADSQGGNYDL